MTIRNATYHDAPAIKSLMEAAGYNTSNSHLIDQLETQFGNDSHQAFVYELKKEVLGFVTLHFLPQLAFKGELAVISCLVVDETTGLGIDKGLEEFVTKEALARKCHRMQVNNANRAHDFYEKQGYREYPGFYIKSLAIGRE